MKKIIKKLLRIPWRILWRIYRGIYDKIIRYRIFQKNGKQLKALKNIHEGERCFIIGNGPSLKIQDIEKLKNEFSFAANKIFVAFEETDWRPTYYCIQDFEMILSEMETLKKTELNHKFIAGNSLISKKIYLNDWIYFFLNTNPFYPNYPGFSEDISKQIFGGWTITYAEIQLAVYMGFKEIYLLGIDFNYAKSINNKGVISVNENPSYFSDKYMDNKEFGKQFNYPNLENSFLAYKAAEQYTKQNGIKIYNATRGGKLEVFERINFDNLTFN
jgi:hypothetical protein